MISFYNSQNFWKAFVAYNIVKQYYTYIRLQKFKNFSPQNL